jgi:site-specific recombinase XerD
MGLILTSWRHDLAARNKAPRTISDYVTSLERFSAWLDQQDPHVELLEVTKHHVRAWLAFELTRVSAKTTVRHYQAVRQFYIWAHAEGEIPVNPTQGIKQPAIQEKLIEVPTVEDIKVLLSKAAKNFEGLRDTAIIMILMDCGLRASELIGLKLDDVDQTNNLLMVLGKGRRMRAVPFGRKTAAALDRYLRARAKRPETHHDELWLGRKGPLTDSGLRQLLARRTKSANLPHLHPHQMRHFFADSWLRAGGAEGDLMRVTGWKSRSMVDRYGSALATSRAINAHKKLSPGDRL